MLQGAGGRGVGGESITPQPCYSCCRCASRASHEMSDVGPSPFCHFGQVGSAVVRGLHKLVQ